MKSREAPGNISGQNYTGDPKPPSVLVSRALKSLPLGFRIKLLIKRSFPVEGREAMAAHIWLGCKVGVGEERDISQLKVSKATKVRTSLQGVLPSLKKKTPRQAHMV